MSAHPRRRHVVLSCLSLLSSLSEQGDQERPRRRLRVVLPVVKDWCIDYSNDTPMIWLITDAAWYMVGGLSNLSSPAANYKASFSLTQAKFEVRLGVQSYLHV